MFSNPLSKNECCATTKQEDRAATIAPAVDVYETAEAYGVTAELPGATKEGLNLRLEENTLRIEAFAPPRRNTGKVKYERAFTLGKGVDLEDIHADLKHGVLTISLPKAAAAKPKRIEVQSLN